ncbi:putative halogenase [Mycena capillaripes]|nr:putative halogenase [Mycena capillaripes]
MSANSNVPSSAKVLVIGGGPGGSYAASALAREGVDVVLLEAAKFPRYHIGESMLPSLRQFLRFINAEEKVEKHGFQKKPGAAILFNQWKREGYTKFGEGNHSWNVERSELDEILLRHAEECGAKVYEEHKVTELTFAEGSNFRPISANFTTATGEASSITFDYLVDASGRAGIMSTKYLKNRHMNANLKNIACWAYWTGADMYAPGTDREKSGIVLPDESGWAWFIPLQDKVVSVGIVMDGQVSASKKAAGAAAAGEGSQHTLQDHYLAQLAFVPRLKKLLGGAELRVDATGETPTVKSASDYSYTATQYAGDHFRLVGDASAFIDPFFSSGVHLAVSGGLTAAVTIAASIRQHCSEEEAAVFHDHKVAVSYTRFFLTVLGAYKQIRNQQVAVLSDIDEGNFDRAFDLIRPVIQGTADAGKMLTEDELQKAMDFVTHIFVPTDPEMQQSVGTRLGMDVLAPGAPILTKDQISTLSAGDKDTEWVLNQANATKSISDFYTGPDRLLGEVVNGLIGCTKVGCLGLTRVAGKPEVRRK